MIYDYAVIGAGFFGVRISLLLAKHGFKVALFEKENKICTRSSYNNQARVHNGYHYPRSRQTLFSSHHNYLKFLDEYKDCLKTNFQKLYGIAQNSFVNAYQFYNICQRNGLPIKRAKKKVWNLFNPDLIEEVFLAEEVVFDITKITKKLFQELKENENLIKIFLNTQVEHIEIDNFCKVKFGGETIQAKKIFNVTYSGINHLLNKLNLKTLNLKQELVEICMIQVPDELQKIGITIMDGPFFSVLPFPAQNCYSLSHVRYTPHCEWFEKDLLFDPYKFHSKYPQKTNFLYMLKDSARFIPTLNKAQYLGSLFEIKSVVSRNEINDGRPIVFKKHSNNLISILGSKIDNIYDLEEKLKQFI